MRAMIDKLNPMDDEGDEDSCHRGGRVTRTSGLV
jgi:hypothetical protein